MSSWNAYSGCALHACVLGTRTPVSSPLPVMPRHTEAVQPSMRVRGQATTPAAPGQTPQGRRGPNPSRWLFARVKGVILASRQTPWVSSLGVFLASTLPLIPFTFERVSSPSAPSVYLGLRFLLFFLDVCLFVSRLFELSVHVRRLCLCTLAPFLSFFTCLLCSRCACVSQVEAIGAGSRVLTGQAR